MTPRAIIGSFILMGLVAGTPDMQGAAAMDLASCPAPIRTGAYDIRDTKARMSGDLFKGGGYVGSLNLPKKAASRRTDGSIELPGECDSGFRLTMETGAAEPIVMDMTLDDWEGANGPVYTGRFEGSLVPNQTSIIEMRAVIPDEFTIVGNMDMKIAEGNLAMTSLPSMIGESRMKGTPLARYECRCRSKLDEWIEEQLESARTYRKLFAERSYRQRPKSFPPDRAYTPKWKPTVYKEVIDVMAGNRGMSFEDAAETVAYARWPGEMPQQQTAASSGSASSGGGAGAAGNAVSIQVAYTDLSSCKIIVHNAHHSECFPKLALDSTMIHEDIHAQACKARGRLANVPDLEAQADEEVIAYQTEIDFLESWVEENCDG